MNPFFFCIFSTSQMITLPSPPDASRWGWAVSQDNEFTEYVCPLSTPIRCHVVAFQIMMVPSSPPDARKLPSGLQVINTWPSPSRECPRSGLLTRSQLMVFQTTIVPSALPDARKLPSRLHDTTCRRLVGCHDSESTLLVCPRSGSQTSSPVFASRMMMVPSKMPEARKRPSGLHDTAFTPLLVYSRSG